MARAAELITIVVGFAVIDLGAFLLALLGHIGSLHHAAHVVAAATGIELLAAGVIAVLCALDEML